MRLRVKGEDEGEDKGEGFNMYQVTVTEKSRFERLCKEKSKGLSKRVRIALFCEMLFVYDIFVIYYLFHVLL